MTGAASENAVGGRLTAGRVERGGFAGEVRAKAPRRRRGPAVGAEPLEHRPGPRASGGGGTPCREPSASPGLRSGLFSLSGCTGLS